ncbi:MAG: DUF3021 domain-containing protein [Clostridia bacterium]|nr:DUF3021 domain-containing protein [Clostridia bacterium]
MNKYLKAFLHRGLMFGGFGPIIVGVIYAILQHSVDDFSLSGTQVLVATVSVYLLTFIQAGASVFNQIEEWSLPKSLLCHFGLLYLAYVGCYLLNSWIPFEPKVVAIFTAIFVGGYFLIWIVVYFSVRAAERKLNVDLQNHK